jgi:2-polyprenyl-3-methyl-5-hydroxy-6-metoxy-1,4-benzoquinol methylase
LSRVSSKLGYFARSLQKRAGGHQSRCPGCGSSEGSVIDRKAGVTELVECSHCSLLYRTPTDARQESHDFYQTDYAEGFTTELPADEELRRLKETDFRDAAASYSVYLDVLQALRVGEGSRIFDYGCSWGYGSYQLMRAGYDVEAFEISRPRCAYAAEKLGVKTVSDFRELGGDFDVFFSAHVLEHLPDLREAIRLAQSMVRPGGLFIAFTPNGSLAYRSSNWQAFHKSWGMVHPNVLQEKYYRHVFRERPLLLASSPYSTAQLSAWNFRESLSCDLSGAELLAAAVMS